jgi:hypothetical protein
MARLLLEQMEPVGRASNRGAGIVILTDAEANELVGKLEALVESREFLEASYFVEAVTHSTPQELQRAREIYLAALKRGGRSRILASRRWSDFLVRLGVERRDTFVTGVKPMVAYFERMERTLLSATDIDPRVIGLITRFISTRTRELEEMRRGQTSLPHGSIRRLVIAPVLRWRDQHRDSQDRQVTTTKVAGALTVVADLSVLFSTRDWSVTGTLSTMAGALVAAITD